MSDILARAGRRGEESANEKRTTRIDWSRAGDEFGIQNPIDVQAQCAVPGSAQMCKVADRNFVTAEQAVGLAVSQKLKGNLEARASSTKQKLASTMALSKNEGIVSGARSGQRLDPRVKRIVRLGEGCSVRNLYTLIGTSEIKSFTDHSIRENRSVQKGSIMSAGAVQRTVLSGPPGDDSVWRWYAGRGGSIHWDDGNCIEIGNRGDGVPGIAKPKARR